MRTMHAKFAEPLYALCEGAFGVNSWGRVLQDEANKNVPQSRFGGMSPRQAMIWFSEDVMKPKFGQDIFGQLAAKNIERWGGNNPGIFRVVVFSDSGFVQEAQVLRDQYKAENILLVSLRREGCTFSGDSRGYIDPKDLGCQSMILHNDGEEGATASPIMEWVESRYCRWREDIS